MDGVDAKAIDAAIEPKSQHVQQLALDLGISEVEVWLLLQIRVVVVLAGSRIELPRRPAELAQPIVGRPTVGRRCAPEVEIAVRASERASGRCEPRVLFRSMVRHVVENDFEPEPMRGP